MYIQLPLLLSGSWRTISSMRLSDRNCSVLLENRGLLGSEWFGHAKGYRTRMSIQRFAFIEEIEIWAIEKYERLCCLCLVTDVSEQTIIMHCGKLTAKPPIDQNLRGRSFHQSRGTVTSPCLSSG
jgi:hypothetical protein